MSDALLTLLKWCLLALIYLFFFRVLQATWFSTNVSLRRQDGPEGGQRGRRRVRRTRTPVPAPTAAAGAAAPAPPANPARLVVIEPADFAGTTYAVAGELTIGRAAGCQITLDDTYVSQLHARLSVGESGVVVEDLGSTNGTYLNHQRVTAPVVVSVGDRIQVGGTILELQP